MRRSILGGILGAAALAVGMATPAIERDHDEVPPAPPPPRKAKAKRKGQPSIWNASHRASGSIAQANRHDGRDHKNNREIERRKRQASAKP